MARPRSLATLPAGRRAKWVTLLIWLVILAVAGPIGSKISTATTTDSASYLPAGAETAVAAKEYHAFPESRQLPALIAYRGDGGLATAGRAKIETDRLRLSRAFLAGRPAAAPVFAPDGKTAMLAIPIGVSGNGSSADSRHVVSSVARIRDIVGQDTGSMRVAVTGPAGYAADSATVYGSVDQKLLLVAVAVLALLLVIGYRSPWLWAPSLAVAAIGNVIAEAGGYLLAKYGGVTMTTEAQGILSILVFGAGTNYGLLLLSRYREELRRHADKHDAMRAALLRAGPAVLTAGATVMVSLICLSAGQLGSTRGLGPIGAVAIFCALAAMLTLLPAVLVICGRWLYWPFVPRNGDPEPIGRGLRSRAGPLVAARPRLAWIVTALVLFAMAGGLAETRQGLNADQIFRTQPGSVAGQKILSEAFHAAATSTTTVIAAASAAPQVLDVTRRTPGIARAQLAGRSGNRSLISATLTATPASAAAHETITALRARAHSVRGAEAVVGGNDAVDLGISQASSHDLRLIVPLVLLVIAGMLSLILRAVVAPLMLIMTVILPFAAALGVSMAAFSGLWKFPGSDPSLPLYTFVFLAAFGTDYSIFLMTRVREEAALSGTSAGVLRGRSATGPVISSAGVLLAATFFAVTVIPLVAVTELGIAVGFGVLLDTFVVRPVLVPALALDLGDRLWWPASSRLPVRSAAGRPEKAEISEA